MSIETLHTADIALAWSRSAELAKHKIDRIGVERAYRSVVLGDYAMSTLIWCEKVGDTFSTAYPTTLEGHGVRNESVKHLVDRVVNDAYLTTQIMSLKYLRDGTDCPSGPMEFNVDSFIKSFLGNSVSSA